MPQASHPAVHPAVFDFLAHRRSYPAKIFAGAVPSRAQLAPILDAALRVPDHGMLTPWRLVVLERAALLRIADLAQARGQALALDETAISKGRGQFERSHLAVVVLSTPIIAHKVPVREQVASSAALCMNILNAASAAGWAAQWLTGWTAHDDAFAAKAFGADKAHSVTGYIHIGTVAGDAREGALDRARPDAAKLIDWIAA